MYLIHKRFNKFGENIGRKILCIIKSMYNYTQDCRVACNSHFIT